MLCTLIHNNPPSRLQLLLVDLKHGLEFTAFEQIPHLLRVEKELITDEDMEEGSKVFTTNGIVTDVEKVPDALSWLEKEAKRRFELLRNGKAKNIGQYNAHRQKHGLSHIVFIVDEYAMARYSAKGKQIESRLVRASATYRAVGIHLVICTQIPKTEVITNIIKANLPARIAFSCTNLGASFTLLDNGLAASIGKIPGRLVYSFEDEIMAQCPLINDEIIEAIIQEAITGNKAELSKDSDVTMMEILSWALDNDNGYLSLRRIYERYKARGMTKATVEKWMAEAQGQEYLIGSTVYTVIAGDNNHSRRIIPAEREIQTTEESNA